MEAAVRFEDRVSSIALAVGRPDEPTFHHHRHRFALNQTTEPNPHPHNRSRTQVFAGTTTGALGLAALLPEN